MTKKELQKLNFRKYKLIPIMLLVACLFMGVGYASINSITMKISGNALARAEEIGEVYISDYKVLDDTSSSNDDESTSTIDSVNLTIFGSTINLPSTNPNGFITYSITVRNTTTDNYMFDGVKYILEKEFYDNENIVFDELIGLKSGDILYSKSSVTFTITFHYKDYQVVDNNSLTSVLEFAFIKTYIGDTMKNMMRQLAEPDNKASKFVTSSEGINFLAASSDTNGNGIYVMAETQSQTNPIYYFRGNVDNNNVVFGKYCWKIVRTTETGGTKLIFNGLKANDGSCNNTDVNTELFYQVNYNSVTKAAGAGYNYTDTSLTMYHVLDTNVPLGTIFAHDVSYDENTKMYTLSDDRYVSTEIFSTEKFNGIKEHHYTCLSATEDSCQTVSFVYMGRADRIFFLKLTNNDRPDDFLNVEFEGNSTNATKSTVRIQIDTWWSNEMTSLNSYLEDTVFCNDRSIYTKNGWTLTGSIEDVTAEKLGFGAQGRTIFGGTPSVICKYKADSFTTNAANGNGLLEHPVALLTLDEAALAGFSWHEETTNNYLYNGKVWWTMSPGFLSATGVYIGVVHSSLDNVSPTYKTNNAGGVRPVISIKSDVTIKSGQGTATSPFIIE